MKIVGREIISGAGQLVGKTYYCSTDINHIGKLTSDGYLIADKNLAHYVTYYWYNSSYLLSTYGIPDVSKLCTSNILNFGPSHYIHFTNVANFNEDVTSWDVSNVKTMDRFFEGTDFNRDINHWDVSSVESFDRMFAYTTEFNQPLDKWGYFKYKTFSIYVLFF